MRTDEFWAVVERARADGAGDAAAVADRACADLTDGDRERIVAWGRHLDKVLAASFREDLFVAAYLINGGCSHEGFDSFRGWLIAQGRDVTARAVRAPDTLAELAAVRSAAATGAEFAGAEVLSIAGRAQRAVAGAELPPGDAMATPEPADFWDFDDEDEMRRRLPRLAGLFLEAPAE